MKAALAANAGMSESLSPDLLRRMHAAWRAANYLSVGQIYLQENPLLDVPLTLAHVKPRLLGHWGTTPGLNRLIAAHDLNAPETPGSIHEGGELGYSLAHATARYGARVERHQQHIAEHGEDLPEIRDWHWERRT